MKKRFFVPLLSVFLLSGSYCFSQISVSVPSSESQIASSLEMHERTFEEMTLTYQVRQANGLWTFEVLGDGNVLFTQAEVLENAHQQGLSSSDLAENAAKLAIVKVKAGTSVPTISNDELLMTKQD